MRNQRGQWSSAVGDAGGRIERNEEHKGEYGRISGVVKRIASRSAKLAPSAEMLGEKQQREVQVPVKQNISVFLLLFPVFFSPARQVLFLPLSAIIDSYY